MIMRELVVFIFVVTVCFSCKKESDTSIVTREKLGYTISGYTSSSNTYAYLQRHDSNNSMLTIDSVLVENGSYVFKGHIENLEPYQVVVNEDVYPLVLENTQYSLKDNAFTGTKLQDDYAIYYNGLKNTDNAFLYQRNFITSHPESILSAIVLKTMLGKTKWRLNQNQLAYEALNASVKQSYLGKEIKAYLNANSEFAKEQKQTATVTIPNKAREEKPFVAEKQVVTTVKRPKPTTKSKKRTYKGVNFEADDLNGDNFILSEVAVKSKYVLIDFWASWCAPCREQNPYLVEVYNMYHDKGFDIVSVSEDRSRIAWRKAVETDGLTWHHVIDDFNRLTNLYNINTIPHTILINGRGEIIASDISPYILKSKLGGLLRD